MAGGGEEEPRRRTPGRGVAHRDLGPVSRPPPQVERSPSSGRAGTVLLTAVVILAVVVASILTWHFHRSSDLSAAAPLGPASRAVVIMVDGAQPTDLGLTRMPNLAALQANGMTYRKGWIGQVESTGVVSAATIATGTYPRVHGIVGLRWRDASSGQVDNPLQPQQVQQGSVDAVMSSHHVASLAELIKAAHPGPTVLSVAGSNCGTADAAGTSAADYILCATGGKQQWLPGYVTGHALPGAPANASLIVPVAHGPGLGPAIEGWRLGAQDDWVASYSTWAMRRTRPALTVIDFPEIAEVAHYVSPAQRSRVVAGLLRGVDRDIGRIVSEIRREKAFAGTVFAVTSGEVAAPVGAHADAAQLPDAIFQGGGEKVYLDADMSAAVGLRDPLQAQPVAQAMQAIGLRGADAVYYKTQAGQSWSYEAQYLNPQLPSGIQDAFGYLVWTMANDTSPDVVVVYAPGTSANESSIAGYEWTGGRLGLQWDDQHIALILSGQGILPGETSNYPARLVDIAPTLASVMGLTIRGTDGVVLGDALEEPPASSEHRQQVTEQWLSPLVDILMRRGTQRSP